MDSGLSEEKPDRARKRGSFLFGRASAKALRWGASTLGAEWKPVQWELGNCTGARSEGSHRAGPAAFLDGRGLRLSRVDRLLLNNHRGNTQLHRSVAAVQLGCRA